MRLRYAVALPPVEVVIPNCCAFCRLGNDNGIAGTQTLCTRDGLPRATSDLCEHWENDPRSLEERYPEYPHPKQPVDPMARVIAEQVAKGMERVEIQPGLVVAMPRGEAA